MKIFLIVVAGVVLLILAVVAIGSLLPKRHVVSRSASYRARPERLYSLIGGPQNWRPDVLRCDPVPNTAGRELISETTRDNQTVSYELLGRVPEKSLERRIATENLPYSGSWTFSLQPHDETTTVRITEDGQVHNPVFRFMSRFVLGHTQTMDAYLRALGKAIGEDVAITD